MGLLARRQLPLDDDHHVQRLVKRLVSCLNLLLADVRSYLPRSARA